MTLDAISHAGLGSLEADQGLMHLSLTTGVGQVDDGQESRGLRAIYTWGPAGAIEVGGLVRPGSGVIPAEHRHTILVSDSLKLLAPASALPPTFLQLADAALSTSQKLEHFVALMYVD